MLRKFLKYEFRATARMLLPLYIATISLAIILRVFFIKGSNSVFFEGVPMFAFGVIMFLFACTMMAIFVVTFFIVVQRFYKNLLGDEGYLMHTLPVQPWKNIMSKLIISYFWIVISIIVAIISTLILIATLENFKILVDGLRVAYDYYYEFFGAWNGLYLAVESLFAGIIQICAGIMCLYAAMALGHLANKNRMSFSFVAFIVMQVIVSSVMLLVDYVTNTNLIEISSNGIYASRRVGEFDVLIMGVVLFAVYFFITNYILSKRLNLE